MEDLDQIVEKLFISAGNNKEVACLGQGNVFSQFYYYTVSYLRAGDILIEHTLNSESSSDYILSLCVIPACFLYRQYLELALKDIYIQYSEDNDKEKEKMLQKTSHDLSAIWKYAKPLIENVIEKSDEEELALIESYVFNFASEDRNSFKYRYPITKKLEMVLPNERKININNLKERMGEIEGFLARKVLPSLDERKFYNETNLYRNKAIEYCKQENYSLAIENYEKSIARKQKWSEKHPDLVIGYAEIANAYLMQAKLDKSLEFHLKCISLYNEIDNDSLKASFEDCLCSIYNRIGLIYRLFKQYSNAIEYYSKSIKASKVADLEKKIAYTGLARIYRDTNDCDNAVYFYNIAIDISTNILGIDSIQTINLKEESKIVTNK